jgi:hypothetical protein
MTNTGSSHTTICFAAAIGAVLALAPANGFAQSRIGIAAQIQNQVNAIQPSGTRTLRLGNDVFAGERIRTGQSSNAQLTFLDQTNLTIGSQSDVVLDRFVFDPNRGAGNVALSATQGALRFISGSQNPSTYKINTPAATIAIRGTLAYTFVLPRMVYAVNGFGHVTATPNVPGSLPIDIPPGYAAVFFLPPDPTMPQYYLIKWDLGLLDLDRLAQILPEFVERADSRKDLIDQHDAVNLPPPFIID